MMAFNGPQMGASPFIDGRGHLFDDDTMGNINHFAPTYSDNILGYDDGFRLSKKRIKKLVHLATHTWLYHKMYKILYWLIVDPDTKKVRLVKNFGEYKAQKKNIYANYAEKREFLKDSYLSKSRLVKFFKKVNVSMDDDAEGHMIHELKDYLKKKLRRKVRSNMGKN